MLGLNYDNEEELNREIFSGKLQREIFDYIKEIYEDREKHPDWYTIELNNENIYYLFDAEVGDECISYEKIYSPGTNKYATIFHNLIEAVYEEFILQRTLWEKNNYKEITINSKMDSQQLYEMITSVTAFAKVEKGRYLDYIKKCEFNFKDTEIIYDACNKAWFKDDSGLSLDYIVVFTCQSLNDKKVKVNEIQLMNTANLLDAIYNQSFEAYTTAIYHETKDSTLKEVVERYTEDVIYNINREDADMFICLYEQDKSSVPKIMVVSGNLAIDNTKGNCFIEEFDCHEKALKWVESNITLKGDIEDMFNYYDPEFVEENELCV